MFDKTLMALLAALAGAAFLYTLYRHRQESARRAALRRAFLDEAQGLFSGGLKAVSPDGFPRITGSYQGHTFDVQAVPDTLNIRKLPTLWVLVSLAEPMPAAGTLSIMMRPRGVEYFSRHSSLPVQMAPDPGLPHDCSVRTDAPEALPPQSLLQQHAAILQQPLTKELVISPRGLRLVWLAEEAHRGRYLIFRDSEMGLTPFPAAALRPLLDHLIALARDLNAAKPETAP